MITFKKLLGKKFFRSTLEDPSVPLSSGADELFEAFGIDRDEIPVNRKTVLGSPAIAAALRRRSETIASLEVGVYTRTENGIERLPDHPIDRLISKSPHPLYSSYHLWQAAVVNLDILGNAFITIKRGLRDMPEELELIPTEQFIDIRQEMVSGEYFYFFRKKNGNTVQIPVGDVIHLRGLNYDGIIGENPIKAFENAIGAGLANDEFSNAFYSKGGLIQFALEAPQQFSPKAKKAWRMEWRRLFSGIKRAFRDIPIIDNGAKLHQLRLDAKQAALVEAKKAFAEDAGRMFNVPSHMIGAGENYTFASVEVMVTDFVMYSIRNTVKQIEAELNRKLFPESDSDKFVKFNIDSLLRGDVKTRTDKIVREFTSGIITKNEARKLSGYNKFAGADFFFRPANMEKESV